MILIETIRESLNLAYPSPSNPSYPSIEMKNTWTMLEVAKKLRDRGVRADVDERKKNVNTSVLQLKRFLYQLIVGDKEWKTALNVRRYQKKQKPSVDDRIDSQILQ